MRNVMMVFLLTVLTAGCNSQCNRCEYYGVKPKPRVAVAHVGNTTEIDLAWDVSQELTQELYAQCRSRNTLVPLSKQSVDEVDFFASETELAEVDSSADFVVVSELIEHQIVPYKMGKVRPLYKVQHGPCLSVLQMKMRLKVIDRRGEEPHLLLQEVVSSNHQVGMDEEGIDYLTHSWGSSLYQDTRFAIAHKRMIGDIIDRIETALADVQ